MRFIKQHWKQYLAGVVSGVGLGLGLGVALVEAGLLTPGQKMWVTISSSFHEKLYNRGPAHTTLVAGLASIGHVASFNSALAAEASLDPR